MSTATGDFFILIFFFVREGGYTWNIGSKIFHKIGTLMQNKYWF